jgi:hypothetical protein
LRAVVPSLVVLAVSAHVNQAAACSLPLIPISHAEFGASFPENGATGVALDSAIAVKVSPTELESRTATPVLTLTDVTTGQNVAGEIGLVSREGFARFKPLVPLQPMHSFVLSAVSTVEQGSAPVASPPECYEPGPLMRSRARLIT